MDSIASGAFITGFIKCSFKVLVWLSSFFSDSTSLLMIIRPSVLLCSFLLRIPFSAFTTSILSCQGNVNKPFFLFLLLTERQWFVSKSPRPVENIILFEIFPPSHVVTLTVTQLLHRQYRGRQNVLVLSYWLLCLLQLTTLPSHTFLLWLLLDQAEYFYIRFFFIKMSSKHSIKLPKWI